MKYFFHLEDGACIRDPKGDEFPDDAAAMFEATKVAQELSKLRIHAYEWRLVVKNAHGHRVGSVPLVPDLAAHAQGVPILTRSIHGMRRYGPPVVERLGIDVRLWPTADNARLLTDVGFVTQLGRRVVPIAATGIERLHVMPRGFVRVEASRGKTEGETAGGRAAAVPRGR